MLNTRHYALIIWFNLHTPADMDVAPAWLQEFLEVVGFQKPALEPTAVEPTATFRAGFLGSLVLTS